MNKNHKVILLAGVVVLGIAAFFIFRSKKVNKDEFEYTISLRTKDNKALLKNSGVIQMNVVNLALKAPINSDGDAILKVPNTAKGKKAQIQLFVVGWKLDNSSSGAVSITLSQNATSTLIIASDSTLSSFSGIVRDENNKPLEGAKVSVQDLSATTNDKGIFYFNLPLEKQNNKQTLLIEKKGYASRKVNVYPALDGNVRIVLEKKL